MGTHSCTPDSGGLHSRWYLWVHTAIHVSCGDYLDNGFGDTSITQLALIGQLARATQQGDFKVGTHEGSSPGYYSLQLVPEISPLKS